MSDTRTNPRGDSTDNRTVTLPVVPLTSTVVLPGAVATLALESDDARRAAARARQGDGRVLLVPQVDGRYAKVGTVAHVENAGELPDGIVAAILRRCNAPSSAQASPAEGLWVEAEIVDDPAPTPAQREVTQELRVVLDRGRRAAPLAAAARDPAHGHEPGPLADGFGVVGRPADRAQARPARGDRRRRARRARARAGPQDLLAEHELAERIRHEVTEGMEKQQREFLLRQQLQAIRKELGDEDDDDGVDDVPRAGGRADRCPRPCAPRSTARSTGSSARGAQNPEQGWIRTWLDTMLDLPWGDRSDEDLDVTEARARARRRPHRPRRREGPHRRVPRVRKLRAERGIDRRRTTTCRTRAGPGAILALVGPPGVGKTSLGESVARALGRTFVRVALGGVRDEAEIRGHRRTYVGAQPGPHRPGHQRGRAR